MKSARLFLVVLCLILACVAKFPKCYGEGTGTVSINVSEFVLKNGMKVLFYEDHRYPVLHFRNNFKVGSVYEKCGQEGLSHLLEHMKVNKGTEDFGTIDIDDELRLMNTLDHLMICLRVAERFDKEHLPEIKEDIEFVRGELSKLRVSSDIAKIFTEHGQVGHNAFTNSDQTCYMMSLPANKLELWCYIESGVMKNLVFRELYTEVDVVLEELYSGENSPSRVMGTKMDELLFAGAPYSKSTIGSVKDLKNFNRDIIRAYYKKYYAPNNAVLVISGDVYPEEAIKTIERYFGSIEPSDIPDFVDFSEGLVRQEKEIIYELPFRASNRTSINFRVPTGNHPDNVVLEVISTILSKGKSSRLFKSFVLEEKVSSVSAGNYGARDVGQFDISFKPLASLDSRCIEKDVFDELNALKKIPIGDDDLENIKERMRLDFRKTLGSAARIADLLGRFELYNGDWRKINDVIPEINKVSAADIQRVAKKYFVPENRVIVRLIDNRKKKGDIK